MCRIGRGLLAIVAAFGLMTSGGATPAEAAGNHGSQGSSGGAEFNVSAEIGGRYANPKGVWDNPCDAPFVYTAAFLSENGTTKGEVRSIRPDGVAEFLWRVSCMNPENGDLSALWDYWIPAPQPSDLVADLAELLTGYLDPPEVVWPNSSPEHGWLFVKVPMDFRIDNLGPVTVTASVTNLLGTVTASATATPSTVRFDSGEGGGTSCSASQAQEPYVPRSYGACSYTYQNSSSIAPNGYSFGSTTTMRWDITSAPADPTIPVSLDTFVEQLLPVSEVQALVTCVGAGC